MQKSNRALMRTYSYAVKSGARARQNARPRVRFDKIFASFLSFEKGRALRPEENNKLHFSYPAKTFKQSCLSWVVLNLILTYYFHCNSLYSLLLSTALGG